MAVIAGPPIPTPRSAATQAPPVRPGPAYPHITFQTPGATAAAPDYDAQALAEAQNHILPSVQALAAQRASAAAASQQAQTSTQDAYAQLAGILKGIGPAVGSGYHSAALDEGMLAKGFADGLAHIQSNAAGQTNQQLGAGTPQATQAAAALGGTGSQNAVYALGGLIPGSSLAQQGAAFQAAAAQLPGTAAGEGLEQVQMLRAKQALTDAGFDSKQADLMARIPGLAQTALDRLRAQASTDAYRNSSLALSGKKLDESVAHDAALEKQAAANATALDEYRIDQTKISARNSDVAAARAAAYQHDLAVNERVKLFNAETSRYRALHPASSLSGGLTASQVRANTATGKALSGMLLAKSGFADQTATPYYAGAVLPSKPATPPPGGYSYPVTVGTKTFYVNVHPPINYQEAILNGQKAGLPLSTVVRQANRIFFHLKSGRQLSPAQIQAWHAQDDENYAKSLGIQAVAG